MILYKEEPYPLQMKNVIMLDSASGGVVYVSKNTYDQALLIQGRFDGDVQRVTQTLICKSTEAYRLIPGLKALIANMINEMPEPLNMLAPFLMYCTKNQGIDWDNADIEMGYGILHQFSNSADFNGMTLMPAEARTNISLPTVILMQYKRTWDDLCSTLRDYAVSGMQPTMQDSTSKHVETTTSVAVAEKSSSNDSASSYAEQNSVDDGDDENSIDEDAFAKLQAKLAAIAAAEPKEPAPQEAPKPVETQKVEEPQQEQTARSVLSEFDI